MAALYHRKHNRVSPDGVLARASPHSALANRTRAEFAAICSGGNDGDKAALETLRVYQLRSFLSVQSTISGISGGSMCGLFLSSNRGL